MRSYSNKWIVIIMKLYIVLMMNIGYKRWIHTIIREFILEYTFNYMSSYTIIEIMWYE